MNQNGKQIEYRLSQNSMENPRWLVPLTRKAKPQTGSVTTKPSRQMPVMVASSINRPFIGSSS